MGKSGGNYNKQLANKIKVRTHRSTRGSACIFVPPDV